MKIHRFIGNFDLKDDLSSIVNKEIYNQAKNVLNLLPGEQIILGDGAGREMKDNFLK